MSDPVHRPALRYLRIAKLAESNKISVDHVTDCQIQSWAGRPLVRARTALIVTVTGCSRATGCSQSGMVWIGTNAELENSSRKSVMVPAA